MLLAAALTLGINLEIDLGRLLNHYQKRKDPEVTCGIKVVGYHIVGRPGQKFGYARQTFTIPPEGFVEVIALPRVTHYVVGDRKLPLEDGASALDGFSLRWIRLPDSPIEGGEIHE